MNKKCYVVSVLKQDFDEEFAEVSIIKVFENEEKGKKMLLELKEDIINNLTENSLKCNINEDLDNGYIIIANELGSTIIECHESEVET